MTMLARSTSVGHELPIGPVTELADVNPSTSLVGLGSDSPVSFIPMADASESGQWIGRQTRKLRQVRSGYTPFQEGDVLFAKITPCMENGKGCHAQGLVNGVGLGSTEFHVLRAKPTADARFLYHWLQSDLLRLAAEAMMTGSAGQRRVPAEFFGRLPIPLLTLPEQRRIAEILDTADRAIGETEVLISKLRQMKTGLMHDLFTRGLDERGQLRDPNVHPEQFKDSQLGRIPREWEVLPMSGVALQSPGSTTIGPFGSNLVAADYRSSGVPVVFVRDIKADAFKWNSEVYVEPDKARQLSAHSVEPGDILATKMGLPPCISCVYPEWMPQGIVTADVIRLRVNYRLVSNRWLSHFINSAVVSHQVRAITGGVTRPKVTLHDFRGLLTALPSLTEQEQVNQLLEAHDARIRAEEAYRDKLKLQKKGLMEDLLTGRVRVKTAQEVGT